MSDASATTAEFTISRLQERLPSDLKLTDPFSADDTSKEPPKAPTEAFLSLFLPRTNTLRIPPSPLSPKIPNKNEWDKPLHPRISSSLIVADLVEVEGEEEGELEECEDDEDEEIDKQVIAKRRWDEVSIVLRKELARREGLWSEGIKEVQTKDLLAILRVGMVDSGTPGTPKSAPKRMFRFSRSRFSSSDFPEEEEEGEENVC